MGILPGLWERIFLLGGCDFTWFWGLAGLKRPCYFAPYLLAVVRIGLQTAFII